MQKRTRKRYYFCEDFGIYGEAYRLVGGMGVKTGIEPLIEIYKKNRNELPGDWCQYVWMFGVLGLIIVHPHEKEKNYLSYLKPEMHVRHVFLCLDENDEIKSQARTRKPPRSFCFFLSPPPCFNKTVDVKFMVQSSFTIKFCFLCCAEISTPIRPQ